MRYRAFGRLDFKPSALGFGVMRLPVIDDDPAHIDEPEGIRMIRYAIDHGVNYVDTAYPYHGGKSEGLLGLALRDGYRDRVKVATKSPVWLVEKTEDFRRYLDEQMERLQVGPIDFYLLHGLDRVRWSKVREFKILKAAEKAWGDGLIKHFGFSFHGSLDLFKEIIDSYDGWEFCQIQYNYMDTEFQAGTEGLRYAVEKSLGVVVMEPIRGGALASPPPSIQELWDTAPVTRSPAEWALRWIWDHPEVSVVLSGMSTMDQVRENVDSAGRSAPRTLTPEELEVVGRVSEAYRSSGWIPCTSCRYCMPCSHGVDIPGNFRLYNSSMAPQQRVQLQQFYARWPEEKRAGSCQSCAECEEKCPQTLAVRELLARVHAALGSVPGQD